MRILFVLPELPWPPDSGGKAKIFNMLSYLGGRHSCDIICYRTLSSEYSNETPSELAGVNVIRHFELNSGLALQFARVKCLAVGLPLSFARYLRQDVAEFVSRAANSGLYDAIHYDIINTAWLHQPSWPIHSVHSPNDATSMVYLDSSRHIPFGFGKIASWISGQMFKKFESGQYSKFSTVHVVSDADAIYLKKLNPDINIKVLPICFNFKHVSVSQHARVANKNSDALGKIVCVGNLGNPGVLAGVVQFLSEVLPLIIQKLGPIIVTILSPVRDYKVDQLLHHFPCANQINWVEDYNVFIGTYDICVLPDLYGPVGLKTRTLNAMASGVPIVGSPVAFSGVPVLDGVSGEVCETVDDYCQRIALLLSDQGRRQAIASAARTLVQATYSLTSLGPKYEAMYQT